MSKIFDNSYLNCYFKLQEKIHKKLNTDIADDESIESLEEHESMMKI